MIFFVGALLKNINPPNIKAAPKYCIHVKCSPSNNPQITATIGITSVVVEANKGVEMCNNL